MTGAERDTKDRADATDGIGAKTGADFCLGDGGSTENHRHEDFYYGESEVLLIVLAVFCPS